MMPLFDIHLSVVCERISKFDNSQIEKWHLHNWYFVVMVCNDLLNMLDMLDIVLRHSC